MAFWKRCKRYRLALSFLALTFLAVLTLGNWLAIEKAYAQPGGPGGPDTPDQMIVATYDKNEDGYLCLLYTSPSPRDATLSRMPSSA